MVFGAAAIEENLMLLSRVYKLIEIMHTCYIHVLLFQFKHWLVFQHMYRITDSYWVWTLMRKKLTMSNIIIVNFLNLFARAHVHCFILVELVQLESADHSS